MFGKFFKLFLTYIMKEKKRDMHISSIKLHLRYDNFERFSFIIESARIDIYWNDLDIWCYHVKITGNRFDL